MMILITFLLPFLAISSAEIGLATTHWNPGNGHRFLHNNAKLERVPKYRRSVSIGGFDSIRPISGFSGNIVGGLPTQQIPTINQNLFEYQSPIQTLPLSTVPQTLNLPITNPSTLTYPSSTITTLPNNFIATPTQNLQPNLLFNNGAQYTVPQRVFNSVTPQIQSIKSFVPNDFSTVRTQTQPIQDFLPNDFSSITTQIQPIQNFVPNDFSSLTTQIQPIQKFVPNDFSSLTTSIQPIQTFTPNEFLSQLTGISDKPPVFKPLDISQIFRSLH